MVELPFKSLVMVIESLIIFFSSTDWIVQPMEAVEMKKMDAKLVVVLTAVVLYYCD